MGCWAWPACRGYPGHGAGNGTTTPALAPVINEAIRPRDNLVRRIIGEILDTSPDDEISRPCAHGIIGQVIHYVQRRPVIAVLWPELNMAKPEDHQRMANHTTDPLCKT